MGHLYIVTYFYQNKKIKASIKIYFFIYLSQICYLILWHNELECYLRIWKSWVWIPLGQWGFYILYLPQKMKHLFFGYVLLNRKILNWWQYFDYNFFFIYINRQVPHTTLKNSSQSALLKKKNGMIVIYIFYFCHASMYICKFKTYD